MIPVSMKYKLLETIKSHFDCIYSENKNILKTTFLACATAILEGGFCLLSSCTGFHSRWTSLVAQMVKRLSTM